MNNYKDQLERFQKMIELNLINAIQIELYQHRDWTREDIIDYLEKLSASSSMTRQEMMEEEEYHN